MCAGTLVHISRQQGKTSNNNNNNKRCQPWICCMLCRACFYWVLHRISGFMIIIILATHTLFYYSCSIPSVYCSDLIIPWVVPAWYHSSCLLAPACLCSRHGFQCLIMIRFYRYTCAYLCTPSGFRLTTRLGSSDSSGSSCPGPGAWSMSELGTCRVPVADLRSTTVAWIPSRPPGALSFQAPCAPLEFFLL